MNPPLTKDQAARIWWLIGWLLGFLTGVLVGTGWSPVS